MQSTRYSSQILVNLEFSRQIFEKISNIRFYENPCIGSRVVPCGRAEWCTDMQTEATKVTDSLFSQLWERASKLGWEGKLGFTIHD